MQRESFVFYRSFAEVMNELSDEDAGKLIKIISAFALDGSVPELSGMLSVCFKLIKPQIEANNKKYLNGCKGGRPKKETEPKPKENQIKTKAEPNQKQKETNSKPNDNDNVNDNVNDNDNDNDNVNDYKKNSPKGELKEKRFAPPSFDDVSKYCEERNNGINPQKFIDFYASKGWMIGKNKMKDWKAAVRNWENRDKPAPQESKPREWGKQIYDKAEEQNFPRFGFPAEWFQGETLIKERVKAVKHPKNIQIGVYEEYDVSAQELVELYELRRRYYFEQRN